VLLARGEIPALLRCPVTREELTFAPDGSCCAKKSGKHYASVQDTPILIDFETSVIDRDALITSRAASSVHRPRYRHVTAFAKQLVSPPKRPTKLNVDLLIKELQQISEPLALIVGGGTVGQGMSPLYDHPSIKVVAFDIYRTEKTQFVADAHAIPLADASVDAVVVQAILEHVLRPELVAQEIWRVLRPGGLVYAETPFLQQVHEGPYDFTRFTESGHRYLFRRFQMIKSGTTAGPGTQLLWSLDYFARGLFRSRTAGKLVKAMFFWLQSLDGVIPNEFASDAASGVFFLGRKSDDELSPKQIVDFYRGAQRAHPDDGQHDSIMARHPEVADQRTTTRAADLAVRSSSTVACNPVSMSVGSNPSLRILPILIAG
jgi:SAM-dependent methyltransferase